MAKRLQTITRWNAHVCDVCGAPIVVALCQDVRMYKRRLKDDYSGTTVTTLHYRLCDVCADMVTDTLKGMKERYNQ